MSKLVSAYDKRTGQPAAHQVPEHWIGNPVLGPHLTRTKPAAPAAEPKADKASTPKEK